jgi:hypothetical protein
MLFQKLIPEAGSTMKNVAQDNKTVNIRKTFFVYIIPKRFKD